MPSSSSEKYIPALGAKYTTQSELLAPWSKRLPNFIDFDAVDVYGAVRCLEALGATFVTATELIQMFGKDSFPSTLHSMGDNVYPEFLKSLTATIAKEKHHSSLLMILSSLPIAADMTGKMHRAHELFDHDDEIFRAAFRDDKSHFLHECARSFTWLWTKIGLHRRESNGCLKVDDYQECLLSLIDLIQSNDYGALVDPISDINGVIRKILSPLITPSSATHQFTNTDWNRVANMSVFLVRKDHSREPSYRRESMDRIAECDGAIPLAALVLHKFAAICWSNTPFVVLEPTSEVLSKVPRHGEPLIGEVWNHLLHMVEISKIILRADIPDFLSDLYEIYDHLQKHLVSSKEYFRNYGPALNQANLWLNLEAVDPANPTIEELQSSWKPISNLLLISSTDAPPLECIRPNLSPYVKLLKELGCKSIRHSPVELPASQSAQSLLSSLRVHRKEKKMTDVVFVAENIRFHAHRIVLACASSYCEGSFSGRWSIDQEISLDTMTAHTLRILIDTAYEEPIDWTEMTYDPKVPLQNPEPNDNRLDLLLNLHKGADYWGMLVLANQVERKILEQFRLFIRLDNVRYYQEMAADSNAGSFEKACKKFCEENEEALRGLEKATADAASNL